MVWYLHNMYYAKLIVVITALVVCWLIHARRARHDRPASLLA